MDILPKSLVTMLNVVMSDHYVTSWRLQENNEVNLCLIIRFGNTIADVCEGYKQPSKSSVKVCSAYRTKPPCTVKRDILRQQVWFDTKGNINKCASDEQGSDIYSNNDCCGHVISKTVSHDNVSSGYCSDFLLNTSTGPECNIKGTVNPLSQSTPYADNKGNVDFLLSTSNVSTNDKKSLTDTTSGDSFKFDNLKEGTYKTSLQSISSQTDKVFIQDNVTQYNISHNSRETQTDKISKRFKKLQTQRQPFGQQYVQTHRITTNDALIQTGRLSKCDKKIMTENVNGISKCINTDTCSMISRHSETYVHTKDKGTQYKKPKPVQDQNVVTSDMDGYTPALASLGQQKSQSEPLTPEQKALINEKLDIVLAILERGKNNDT